MLECASFGQWPISNEPTVLPVTASPTQLDASWKYRRLRRGRELDKARQVAHPLAPPDVMAGARIVTINEVVEIDI
jgi:hypothetical protein